MKSSVRGFTLLELLVALAIFALMSAMAFRGLNVMLDTRQQVTSNGRKWQDLARLQTRLQQDLAQVVLRQSATRVAWKCRVLSGNSIRLGKMRR